jgi:protein-S-isoprenylcysteine O-methyltransferase Ste14
VSLLELDPNVVKPGWTALIVILLLAVAMVLLYLSMRRQFRKITIPRQEPDDQPATPTEPTAGTSAE